MTSLAVLRISERIPPLRGGKEIHIAELTRAQIGLGHDIQVLCRRGDEASLGAPAAKVMLPRPLAGLGGLAGTAVFSMTAARWAGRVARPDLVHVHGDWTEAWCMARYARRTGAAMVLTVHAGLNPRYVVPSRRAFSYADAVIAHGEGVRADLLRCGVPDERVTVMSSGLNTDLVEGARSGTERDPGLVVTVGSLDTMKNIDTIIRAVKGIPDAVGAHLEVIGDGPLRNELEALGGGDSRIRFLGQLSRSELYRRVAAADAFVIASRRLREKAEGIPTALLEAMALGRLSLVSTAATPRPVVTDDASYWTFDPEDEQRLRALIVEAVTDEQVRVRVGGQARAAVAHLGWGQLARRVDEVYDRALSTHRRRR